MHYSFENIAGYETEKEELKKLVPYLAERQVLQAEESDELLKQWGGLRYE